MLQLDGANTYSGATAVALGTLAGAGTVANTVTVNAGAHIAPGDNTSGNFGGVGTLTLGGLTLNTNAQIDLDLGTTSDLLAVSGVLTVGNAFVNIQNSGGLTSGTYEVMSYGSLVGNATPCWPTTCPQGFPAFSSTTPARTRSTWTSTAGRRPGPAATARPGTPRRSTGA